MSRIRTALAALAALTLLPIAMVVAAPAASAATCGGFGDVTGDNPFCADIAWLGSHDIAQGYSDGDFRPRDAVSRQVMAALLYRLTNPGAAAPDCGSADPFRDVPTGSTFCGATEWLIAQGVTNGYDDDGFHPTAAVTRQAMAAFLYRLAVPGTTPPPCQRQPFSDVRLGDQFCGAISWLVGRGIAQGFANGSFHPADPVSRQAMAAFLHRLDPDLTLRGHYTVFGDGTYRVGTDVQPGTYRTRHGTASCYWQRTSAYPGSFSTIIASDGPIGPAVVTIGATDKGFTSEGCGLWTTDLTQVPASTTTNIGDGTWIVGTDITPGTWHSPVGELCYWARLASFSGRVEDIIANNIESTAVTITIKATDKGFVTDGCGPWSRTG